MPSYFALLVPGGLALFAAVAGVVWVLIERKQERSRLARNAQSEETRRWGVA
jgi:hypothetical protein